MNIFLDFHHSELASGLIRLFCTRLGHKLYFPGLGKDGTSGWFHYEEPSGVMQWGNPCADDWIKRALSKKFLVNDPGYNNWVETYSKIPSYPKASIEESKKHHISAGYGSDPEEKDVNAYCVSWNEFQDLDVDLFIVTCTQNLESFSVLKDLKPNAYCAAQSGNQEFDFPYDEFPNLLSSSVGTYARAPDVINKVYYWQEIDIDFRFADIGPPKPEYYKTIRTYQHYANQLPWYNNWERFQNENLDFDLIAHGAGGVDLPDLGWDQPFAIRDSCAQFHWKCGTEGYGLNLLHNLMMGRPVIGNYEECKGQTREFWLKPGVSMIDIANDSYEEFHRVLTDYATNEQMILDYYQSTIDFVRPQFDFEQEADKVSAWLDDLN